MTDAHPADQADTVDTPHGPARVDLRRAADGRAVLLLGHGAGGGTGAPDLVAVTAAALDAGVHVALVEQPYRVAGRRAPAPARQLDAAWLAVAAAVRGRVPEVPVLFGGRSSGARVACRTAGDGGAVAVLCLAFPEHPPNNPDRTRQPELDAVTVPVLIVQGARDPFGRPHARPPHELVVLNGDHGLKSDVAGVAAAVTEWLGRVV